MYKFNILVVGESMLDKYTQGSIKRLNPESPTQLVNKQSENYNLGGSANVCRNLSGLGAKVDFLTLVNENEKVIPKLCKEDNINLIPVYTKRKTTTKERITVSGYPILRIDDEDSSKITEEEFLQISNRLTDLSKNYDAIICSDYKKGLFNQNLCDLIKRKFDNYLFADAKPANLEKFVSFDTVKTNFTEFKDYLEEEITNDTKKIEEIFRKLAFSSYLLTRSEQGMSYLTKDKTYHQREKAQEVFDVTGAGDTVTASFVLEYLNSKDINSALKFANKCANIVISKHGCVSIKNEDLLA